MPRSFALGAHFETFIEAQVQGGRYNNASEVVRDGLRLLEDLQVLREARVAELREAIVEARKDDQLVSADEVFDRLEAKYEAMAREDRKRASACAAFSRRTP